jgi:hypothetical protein
MEAVVDFKRWIKKKRIEVQDLDNTIEEELQEKVTDKSVKKK